MNLVRFCLVVTNSRFWTKLIKAYPTGQSWVSWPHIYRFTRVNRDFSQVQQLIVAFTIPLIYVSWDIKNITLIRVTPLIIHALDLLRAKAQPVRAQNKSQRIKTPWVGVHENHTPAYFYHIKLLSWKKCTNEMVGFPLFVSSCINPLSLSLSFLMNLCVFLDKLYQIRRSIVMVIWQASLLFLSTVQV